jgi:hypothetical protein
VSGFGEGQSLVAAFNVTTDGFGTGTFSVTGLTLLERDVCDSDGNGSGGQHVGILRLSGSRRGADRLDNGVSSDRRATCERTKSWAIAV